MRLRTPLRRHQSRRYTGIVVGAVAVLSLAACTGSAEDAADDENSGSDSAPAAAAGGRAVEGDRRRADAASTRPSFVAEVHRRPHAG